MNLSLKQGSGGNAGAVELGGSAKAAPVNPAYQVGEIGFGPMWNDEPSVRELYDQACASIVRAECEADELRAEVAILKQAMLLLAQERDEARARVKVLSKCWREAEEERDEARLQYRSTHALAESLVKTIGELKSERVELKATINTYRDEACRESCRDKAQADGGWGNI
jgi:chromosome segregation ATPase